MARYYTVFSSMTKALKEAKSKAATEGCSQTVFQPYGSKPGWFIVGPSADAPDIVAGGAIPVYSLQHHPRPSCPVGIPQTPVVDWENEARGLCDVIKGLHAEIAVLTARVQEAEHDNGFLYGKLRDVIQAAV